MGEGKAKAMEVNDKKESYARYNKSSTFNNVSISHFIQSLSYMAFLKQVVEWRWCCAAVAWLNSIVSPDFTSTYAGTFASGAVPV